MNSRNTIVLHSVSAGGAYCAKTARARAAALGLDYPGVHGAPDLSGPAHHGIPPHSHEWVETEPNMVSSQQNWPTFDNMMHKEANLGISDGVILSHSPHRPVQSRHSTNLVHSFPRGQSVSNRESSFKEVKHFALPRLAEAPGQFAFVNGDPEGHSFVYSERDVVVDDSVPNRHGTSLHALPVPQSWGHGAYQRGLTAYGLGRNVPVLGSNRFLNKGHGAAMTSWGSPVFGSWRYRFPGLNVKQFVQGNPTPWWSYRSKIRSR
ncbi:uncharacterized protein LOC115794939 isoform X2 [Archocentrus centrarchus]|uniref:uncharacterized protein LOC115794939 isoform X2 n=1 Tax=Archocentrus centrarchus TaxID=63155 RepID=UPI0011E9E4BF|nr:uncharacterized protein LOC115794939 isoform X2 [Archocentrus centrarchus]